jgi:hypothetical protein
MRVSGQVVDGWNTSDLVHTGNTSCGIKAHMQTSPQLSNHHHYTEVSTSR